MPNKSETPANVEDVGQPKREASLAAPTGSAKFVPDGDGKKYSYKEGSVEVYRGATTTGIKCLCVVMRHESGNENKILLTLNGAAALSMLLHDALSPNDQALLRHDNPKG